MKNSIYTALYCACLIGADAARPRLAQACTVKKIENFYSQISDYRDFPKYTHWNDPNQYYQVNGGPISDVGTSLGSTPYYLRYAGSYKPGYFIYGPYLPMPGPGKIYASVVFTDILIFHGLAMDDIAFVIDLTAEHGQKVLDRMTVTRKEALSMMSRKEMTKNLKSSSEVPLNGLEIRVGMVNPKSTYVSMSVLQTSIDIAYDDIQSNNAPVSCD